MCGISGYLAGAGAGRTADGAIEQMNECLVHRGPDAGAVWRSDDGGIALGHRRLSIVDLSSEGSQPMTSHSGRFVIVFNGEVYNFRELEKELVQSGVRFRGHSDTEVMLEAIEAWGLERAVVRFVGIFAFALWDIHDRRLHLVRDHVGVKPLYYGWVEGHLVFASELKAIARFPGFAAAVDRGALALFLRHGYVPAPYSIYEGIRKLPAGTLLSLDVGARQGDSPAPRAYWSARSAVERGLADPLAFDDAEAVDFLDGALRDAVGLQMQADVPLGAFLSGGIDSSTVVALMQAQSSRAVKTFTIGYANLGFNEAPHAKRVAEHLGTDHTELYVSAADALEVIPRLPRMYDEPFSDSSQIPTHLVSRLARQEVIVSLSGDGGDELFAGYNRHVLGDRIQRRLRPVPMFVRRMLANILTAVPPERWASAIRHTPMMRSTRYSAHHLVGSMQKLSDVLRADGAEAIYRQLVSQWKDPGDVVIGAVEPATVLTDVDARPIVPTFTEQMMYLDLVSYLPDDILVKVDRASMAVGLEARVPLLDHRIIELAWRLPLSQKLRGPVGKWALRQVLYKYVPAALIERPKAGFGVPIGEWLRGPLREWAESLLDADRLRDEGFFVVAPIREKWDAHINRTADWQHHLWTILMFQSWYAEQRHPR